MRIRSFTLAVALLSVVAVAAPRPGATAPGASRSVRLVALTGLPADTLVRQQFLAGFHEGLAADALPTERSADAKAWAPVAPTSNRFQWLEGDPGDDAGTDADAVWGVSVVIGAPSAVVLPARKDQPGHRALESRRRSRGMIAAIVVQPPAAGGQPPPAVHERFAFAFPAGGDPGSAPAVPAIGYVYPWSDAGRIVAQLALEVLHHRSGDLDEDSRLSIEPALRTDAGR